MNNSFPLFLLKLAAAAATGTAALVSLRRYQRLVALNALHRNILHALLHLPEGATLPPVILVIGFRGHGKSAFVNTACRALAGEEGPMILRSETAPEEFPPPPATVTRLAVSVVAAAGCGCGGWVEEMAEAVEFIDAPPLPEPEVLGPAQVEAALEATSTGTGAAQPPECVVVVMRCSRRGSEQHLAVRRLTEIAGVLRDRGLPLLIVLTHKRSLRHCKQEELKLEVAFRARTDCVYFIESYTAKCSTKCRVPTVIKNDFDTHYTALTIIRQCIEFVAQRRRQSSRKMIELATQVDEKNREGRIDSNKS